MQNFLKNNHNLNIKDIKKNTQKKWNIWVNKTKAIRARFIVRDMVNDFFLGDHTIIYDYCHEILKNNMGQQSN